MTSGIFPLCLTPCMKPSAAIKKLASEAAFAGSYSAMLIAYPVIKIGGIGAGYFPSKQCFVIISNVTYVLAWSLC